MTVRTFSASMGEGEFQAAEKLEDHGQLHGDLEGATNNRGPGRDDDEGVLRAARPEGDHAGDHGDVPEHGRGVGDEKFAMAVEDAEAPGGSDEQACAGKEDADEEDGELALLAVEAGGDGVDEPGGGENTEENEERSADGEESRNGTGGFAGFFFVFAGEQVGVNGNEGGGEDAFAEKVLQEVGDAEGGFEDVGRIGVAEIVSEHAIADESGKAAEEECQRRRERRSVWNWWAEIWEWRIRSQELPSEPEWKAWRGCVD